VNKTPRLLSYLGAATLLLAITGCEPQSKNETQAMQDNAEASAGLEAQNPFFNASTLPFATLSQPWKKAC